MNPGMPYGRTNRPHRIGVSAYYVFTNMFFTSAKIVQNQEKCKIKASETNLYFHFFDTLRLIRSLTFSHVNAVLTFLLNINNDNVNMDLQPDL